MTLVITGDRCGYQKRKKSRSRGIADKKVGDIVLEGVRRESQNDERLIFPSQLFGRRLVQTLVPRDELPGEGNLQLVPHLPVWDYPRRLVSARVSENILEDDHGFPRLPGIGHRRRRRLKDLPPRHALVACGIPSGLGLVLDNPLFSEDIL